MDAEVANTNYMSGVLYRLVPAILPVLLISIGYVDPGKWAVIVEAGAHFGFDLVAPMLIFNFAAILCQYLSACIAVVTGRDLSQICGEEYDKWTCLFLGVQTEVSVILLDVTMVLGIAHGLNLLMGLELSTCVFLAAADAILFPIFAGLVENYKTKFLWWIFMAGVILLSYVLGMLISQPEIPLSMSGLLPKLSGDSAFSLMCLLGASMMPHNFYLHSSIVKYQGQLNISTGSLCYDHLFAILCIFSGIYLVNYVLMNAAANLFYSTSLVLLTFQDAMSLMEQVSRSPVAPLALILVLFFSNQIIALNWNLHGQVIVQDLLRLDFPGWLHRATTRIISIVAALYCVWTSGAEGIYQLLIFTQIMVAILLPSSVIPLFRVASSRQVMGLHKISQFLEFLVLITFMGMLGLKLLFMVEMVCGNSDWVGNLRWSTESSISLPFAILLVTACASFCLMLWLAATPLKSASSRNDAQVWSWDVQQGAGTFTEREEDYSAETKYLGVEPIEKQESVPAVTPVKKFDVDFSETIMESDQEICLAPIEENCQHIAFPSTTLCPQKESASVAGPLSASTGLKEATGDDLLESKSLIMESADPVVKTVGIEGDIPTKKDEEGDSWDPKPDESSKDIPESMSALISDGTSSLRSIGGKVDDIGNSPASLSRLVGLGRAVRRQLAVVLDEFWGQLYDYHGQVTQEARTKKLDLLLGFDTKPASSLEVDSTAKEFSGYIPNVGRAADSMLNSSLYYSPKQQIVQNSMDSSLGVQRGSSLLWSNHMQLLDAYVQNSNQSSHDNGERRYSSLHIPAEASGERRYSSLCIPAEASSERRYSSLRIPSEDFGERRYSSMRFPSEDSSEKQYSSLRIPYKDSGERRYSSLHIPSGESDERRYFSLHTTSPDSWSYQPATVHSSDIAHLSRIARDRNSEFLNGQWESPAPKSPSLGRTNYVDPVALSLWQKMQNGMSSVQATGFQSLVVSRNTGLQSERPYFDVSSSGPTDSVSQPPTNEKKYHSMPDISGLSIPLRDLCMSNKGAHVDGSLVYKQSVGRPSYEPSLYSNPGSKPGTTLVFDELSPSNVHRGSFPLQISSGSDIGSLWSRQPFEQFGVADKSRAVGEGLGNRLNVISQETSSVADAEAKLLQSFRHCIVKILKLEGSEWLFRLNDGADEELIDQVAAREKFLFEAETREINQVVHLGESHYLSSERKFGSKLKSDDGGFTNFLVSSVPNCGDGCIWRGDLITSFGVWCIHRILSLTLMESRPELWGKYTYVLNRLQGVIDLAFSRPRSPMSACFCIQMPGGYQKSSPPLSNGSLTPAAKPGRGKCTTAAMLLDLIKDVESAISCRKGRTGTAAGDVAFPKGKENLASVLKRYKRRLSNIPASTLEVSRSQKVLTASAYGS